MYSRSVFGAVGFVWAWFFFRWFRDRPADHPAVNAAELALMPRPEEANAPDHVNVPWTNKNLTVKWEHFVSKLEPNRKETFTALIMD